MILKVSTIFQFLCSLTATAAFTIRTNSYHAADGSFFLRNGNNDYRVETQLRLFKFLRTGKEKDEPKENKYEVTVIGNKDILSGSSPIPLAASAPLEEADLVIVGGGVSGLTAAITAAEAAKKKKSHLKIVLVEANSNVGGRVFSDRTDDGFVLDQGFAVFIEEYPEAKKLLDYDALKLKPFLPGALVKLQSRNKLARVADPIREPGDTLNALFAPVGSFSDKVDLLPLILNVRTKSIEELFEERETDTETALIERWGFSDEFISKFFKPFLEGIYLAPLSQQSSRMFSFIFKMFSEGSATLPEGGMGAVSAQLRKRAEKAGVDIRTNLPITRIREAKDNSFIVETSRSNRQRFRSNSLIVATDGQIAQKLLSNIEGFESLEDLPEQAQQSVGCLYYAFKGRAPVEDPILILNGVGESGTEEYPINNVCFPSVVNKGYAPDGYSLCSVTVLGKAMDAFKEREDELDQAVRRQLGTWFREQRSQIIEEWELKKIYFIPNAQPAQYKGPLPASIHGGRPTNNYRGKELPDGLFVCGDHMATATLNGALESGVAAGQAAASFCAKKVAS